MAKPSEIDGLKKNRNKHNFFPRVIIEKNKQKYEVHSAWLNSDNEIMIDFSKKGADKIRENMESLQEITTKYSIEKDEENVVKKLDEMTVLEKRDW